MNSKPDNNKTPSHPITIALAGNPNSGKTSIFNHLTGTHQHVGNYPGVTVEKKEGTFTHQDRKVTVVDLPGTYCLTAHSLDELVARNYIINEKPDVIVDVVDSSNLERNLYLGVQLMELGVPLIFALNMSDVADNRGHDIDTDLLSRLLGVTIVQTVGSRGKGIDKLKDEIVHVASAKVHHAPTKIHYGREIEKEIESIVPLLNEIPQLPDKSRTRWLALKLLENDKEIKEETSGTASDPSPIINAVSKSENILRQHFGDSPEVVIADQRYGFISGACQEAVKYTVEERHSMSDRIDTIITHRVLGIPVFLGLMYGMFYLTFTVGEPLMNLLDTFFSWTSVKVATLWPAGTAAPLKSLVIDGIIGGVGGILVFFPNIAILFMSIAILEDSGYMARAAFIMDRFMHKVGLHGKSFIPMIIGFGCTVPAILATRILESRRDRLTTMLVLPLMSCGARFPIYTLFIAAFFPQAWRARILMLLYLIGIMLAVMLIKLLRVTIFKGESTPFVMELPPYRMPTVRGILTHTWERSWLFLRKAGTVILLISIILWVLTSYPKPPSSATENLDKNAAASVELSHSVAGRIGHALEPVMRPIGFDWKTSTALLGAIAAKEVFVTQLGIVFAIGDADGDSESLRDVLQREYTPLQAFCVMLFCLISIPCMATIAVTWKESGALKWALLQLGGLTLLAYLVTFAVFQTGQFINARSAPIPPTPAQNEIRVVSLAPSLTEIVCALDGEKTLVGRTSACDYPASIKKNVRVIGGFGTPSLELLVAAAPTLVLHTDMADQTITAKISELGFTIGRVRCKTFNDIPEAIEKIGSLINRKTQAMSLGQELRRKTASLRQQAALIKNRPTVYVEIWNDPIMSVGKDSFISELVYLAGGKNIGDEIRKEYFATSPEWVISKNPDIILCLYMSRKGSARETMLARTGWNSVTAIRTGSVHDGFDDNLLLRPGPRVFKGIEALQQCIQKNK